MRISWRCWQVAVTNTKQPHWRRNDREMRQQPKTASAQPRLDAMKIQGFLSISSFIQTISIAPLQVRYYSEVLPTQHGCVAARAGFEPTTLLSKCFDSTDEPQHPTKVICHLVIDHLVTYERRYINLCLQLLLLFYNNLPLLLSFLSFILRICFDYHHCFSSIL